MMMPMDYLTDKSDELCDLHNGIAAVERTLRFLTENLSAFREQERYLTGEETCRLLHISPRTLQTLRDRRIVSFTVVGERTILYPESALHELLMRNYRPAKNACK